MLYHHRHHESKIKVSSELSVVRLLIALSLACIATVWALKMNSLGLSESTIGFISSLLALVSIITALSLTPLLEKFNEKKILVISMILQAFGFFIMGYFHNVWIFLIGSFMYYVLGRIRRTTFSILFKDNVKNSDLNKSEGLMYVLVNVGWLIGPMISGFFLSEYGMNYPFYAGTALMLLSMTLFLILGVKEVKKERESLDLDYKKNIKEFFKNKKLILSYIISAGISGWWGFVYLYIPLAIINSGIDKIYLSYFFTAVVVPLILFEYKVGELSEKKGFRPFLVGGFGGLVVLGITLFFIQNIFLLVGLVVFGSVFVSCLEPLKDTFFFKHVTLKEEEKFYPIYSSAMNFGEIVVKSLVALTLVFLPVKFSYLILAGIMAIVFVSLFFHEDE